MEISLSVLYERLEIMPLIEDEYEKYEYLVGNKAKKNTYSKIKNVLIALEIAY